MKLIQTNKNKKCPCCKQFKVDNKRGVRSEGYLSNGVNMLVSYPIEDKFVCSNCGAEFKKVGK